MILRNYYTLLQVMEMLDLPYHEGILVNNMPADENTKIYDNFTITDNASYTEAVISKETDYNSFEELPDDDEYSEEISFNATENTTSYTKTASAITFGSGEDAISVPIADYSKKEGSLSGAEENNIGGSYKSAAVTEEDVMNGLKKKINPSAKNITVTVNGTVVTLEGKLHYLLVDVLDFYTFDMTEYRGRLILEVNGVGDMDFTSPIKDGDQIRMAWSE